MIKLSVVPTGLGSNTCLVPSDESLGYSQSVLSGRSRTFRVALALLLVGVALFASGCKKRTVQAAPPVLVSQPAPAQPQPETKQPEVKAEPAPTTPAPAPIAPTPKPASPRTTPPAKTTPAPTATPATEPAPAAPRVAPPQISPRLSPGEVAEYQKKTEEAIGAAERNLQRSYGRQLNSAQTDLVEKIRGFLAQAREASRAADWVRARNLAEKAQVLSVELVNSL